MKLFSLRTFIFVLFLSLSIKYVAAENVVYSAQAGKLNLEIREIVGKNEGQKSEPIKKLVLKLYNKQFLHVTPYICGKLAGSLLEGISSNEQPTRVYLNVSQSQMIQFDHVQKMIKIHMDGLIAEMSYDESLQMADAIIHYYRKSQKN